MSTREQINSHREASIPLTTCNIVANATFQLSETFHLKLTIVRDLTESLTFQQVSWIDCFVIVFLLAVCGRDICHSTAETLPSSTVLDIYFYLSEGALMPLPAHTI
eukprot:2850668-Amphidinium_carterae.1